jgi:hypothetical protein
VEQKRFVRIIRHFRMKLFVLPRTPLSVGGWFRGPPTYEVETGLADSRI